MQFIRFTNNSPIPFDQPDDEEFEKNILDYFSPRSEENGKSSFFLFDSKILNFIVTGYIARKKHEPKNQRIILIDESIFNESNVKIQYEKTNIFSCIEKYHYCADFNPPNSLGNFIKKLKENLSQKSNNEFIKSFNRSQIRDLLKISDRECSQYERELCSDWTKKLLSSD